jgi:hypothetical protein
VRTVHTDQFVAPKSPTDKKAVRADDDDFQGALGLTAETKNDAPLSDASKSGAAKRGSRSNDPHVADALRNAYQQAVGEDVPQEFLDLLGKLA